MKNLLKIIALFALLVGAISHAQVSLQDFSAVVGPDTYFYGNWELANTQGTNSPNASFSQSAGSYSFSAANSTNDENSKVEFFYTAGFASIGSFANLSVTAQGLVGNAASSFAVTLVDSASVTASATFIIAQFPTGGFTTQVSALTFNSGFNPLAIESLIISGNQPSGAANFRVSFDQISAVSAVPEPSTYALICGLVTLGVIAARRRAQARLV